MKYLNSCAFILITTIKNQKTMKKYIGTKTIMAKPMAKSEAEKVLNRSLDDAKGGEDGYLVEYPDGYKSWSPKETFEEAYKVADSFIDRLQIEFNELAERLDSLDEFLSRGFDHVAEKVGYKQEAMLISQRMAMKAYFDMLDTRIDDLKQSNNAPSQTQG